MSDSAFKVSVPLDYGPVEQHAVANENTVSRSFVLKRLFDLVMSAFALVVLAPVLVGIALALRIKHPGVPLLYGNKVVGMGGKTFSMWKFSTMRADAHVVLENMLQQDESLRKEWTENVKLQSDPRVLPGFGNFLRRTSLNELPQFFNVLMGDMSLVGPRPITKPEEALYIRIAGEAMLARRHSQRPGITGLWQATGRSDVSYEERVKLDDSYLEIQTFAMDLKLMWWTVRKVISRDGAV